MSTLATRRTAFTPVEAPSPDDQELARSSSRTLSLLLAQNDRALPELSFPSADKGVPDRVALPASAAPLIAQILAQLARGQAVTVIPVNTEMTTQQASEILGVSRPHLVRMLEEKRIPFRKVGAHRRVRFSDLMAYKAKEDAARQKSLDALAAQAQELGLGY